MNPQPDPDDPYAVRRLNLSDYGAEHLIGPAPPVKWLISGNVPLGVPAVLAAMGDTGKSFLTLQLCHRVAQEPFGRLDFGPSILGGQVAAHGTAVFITSEDSKAAVHRRLAAIDPDEERRKRPGKLIVVALPDAGGPMPLFVRDNNGVVVTPEWPMLCEQLAAIPDLKLVVLDPLANFAQVALDKDSGEASAVAAHLGTLASQTGATVMATHHMRKAAEAPRNVAEARDRIRGSSGIVDGVRLAYALWPVDAGEGKKVCSTLQIQFRPNRVVCGAVVKANEQAGREIATYVRSDAGLLIDRSSELRARRPDRDTQASELIAAVALQATAGRPFTLRGKSGLYEQRERLPESLRAAFGRDRLEAFCRDLIDGGRIVQCIASGSHSGQWLDVPGGPFALGTGEFVHGAST